MKLINRLLMPFTHPQQQTFFITTPIFYVNSSPHLGHLYSAVICDAAQRFQNLVSPVLTIFSTGTDEHGLKVQKAAFGENSDPHKLCDDISVQFKNVFDHYSVQYTDFIRTTEERHKTAVCRFFSEVESRGFISKNNYEGWYCVSDETFLTEKQIEKKPAPNGSSVFVSKESGHPVEWTSEVNYIFKLSKFQGDLIHWLKEEGRVFPVRFQNELEGWISSGLYDLSISRPKSRVSWGIPLPNDKDHTVYVWLDALTNYLTVAGYPHTKCWPPNLQVIGKDILRFHGIYWPALLMAAGLEPPERLLVHSHWKIDGIKMSKSLGNVICPLLLSEKFTPDAVRYVLLKMSTFHSDGSWSDLHAAECANADLANTLGNLYNRCCSKSLNPTEVIPSLDDRFVKGSSPTCKSLLNKMEELHDVVGGHFQSYNYNIGINEIMDMVRNANLFIEEEKPWTLKSTADKTKLESIIFIGLLAVRSAAICLQPIVPIYASKMLDALNIPKDKRMWHHLRTDHRSMFGTSLGKRIIPFERIKL